MNYSQFVKAVSKTKIAPLYVVTGGENFLKKEVIQILKKQLGEDRIFFKEYLADSHFQVQDLMNDLYSKALFDEYNFIIVKDAQIIASKLGDPLLPYVQSPPGGSTLLLDFEKIDQRLKIAKDIIKNYATVIECQSLKENEVLSWLEERAKHYRKKLHPEVAHMLLDLVGNSLGDLDLQMQKLALFRQDRSEIQPQDLKELVQGTKRVNIFDLVDAIASRNSKNSLQLCDLLFERGMLDKEGDSVSDPTQIALTLLRNIHNQLKRIWKVTIAKDRQGMPEFLLRKAADQGKAWDEESLLLAWRQLMETEQSIKSSQVDHSLAIENFILSVGKGGKRK